MVRGGFRKFAFLLVALAVLVPLGIVVWNPPQLGLGSPSQATLAAALLTTLTLLRSVYNWLVREPIEQYRENVIYPLAEKLDEVDRNLLEEEEVAPILTEGMRDRNRLPEKIRQPVEGLHEQLRDLDEINNQLAILITENMPDDPAFVEQSFPRNFVAEDNPRRLRPPFRTSESDLNVSIERWLFVCGGHLLAAEDPSETGKMIESYLRSYRVSKVDISCWQSWNNCHDDAWEEHLWKTKHNDRETLWDVLKGIEPLFKRRQQILEEINQVSNTLSNRLRQEGRAEPNFTNRETADDLLEWCLSDSSDTTRSGTSSRTVISDPDVDK